MVSELLKDYSWASKKVVPMVGCSVGMRATVLDLMLASSMAMNSDLRLDFSMEILRAMY